MPATERAFGSSSGAAANASLPTAEPAEAPAAATRGAAPALRQRRGERAPGAAATVTASEGASGDGALDTPPPTPLTEIVAATTLAAAIPAAAWQTLAARFVCTVLMAAAVVAGWHPRLPLPPALQLLVCNTGMLLAAAWQLLREPNAARRVAAQRHKRFLHAKPAVALEVVRALAGPRAVEFASATFALGFAAYADSGCYLAAVTVFHLLARERMPLVEETSS